MDFNFLDACVDLLLFVLQNNNQASEFTFVIIFSNFCSIVSCLQVRWDDMEANRLNRVSPWEIEPSSSVPSSSMFVAAGSKRTRINLPSSKPDIPVPSMAIYVLTEIFDFNNFYCLLHAL